METEIEFRKRGSGKERLSIETPEEPSIGTRENQK